MSHPNRPSASRPEPHRYDVLQVMFSRDRRPDLTAAARVADQAGAVAPDLSQVRDMPPYRLRADLFRTAAPYWPG